MYRRRGWLLNKAVQIATNNMMNKIPIFTHAIKVKQTVSYTYRHIITYRYVIKETNNYNTTKTPSLNNEIN